MSNNVKRFLVGTLMLFAAVILSGCGLTGQGQTSSTTQSTPAASVQDEQVSGTTVEIKNFAFSPATITVKAGETVTITNRDVAGHSFTSDDGTSFDSGIIGKDQSKTITAPNKPGSYPVHCIPHPSITGILVVE